MKKVLLVIMIIILLLTVIGCNFEDDENIEVEKRYKIDEIAETIEYLTVDDVITYEDEEVRLESDIKVYVDGELLKKSTRFNKNVEGEDVEVLMFRRRSLIPLRDFADALDIELAWEGRGQKQHVYMYSTDRTVKFFVNSNKFILYDDENNFKEMYTETPSILYEGTLYVPVRFLVEVLGMDVEWEGRDIKIDRR